MRVLNVGGGSKDIPIPAHYAGWEHVLLDISPRGHPDVVCDARELTALPGAEFDAVYCSHNLEHYHRHDGPRVLGGFLHVLRPDGFAEIHVPDLQGLIRHVADTGIDIEDVLYVSPAGPVTPRDLLYGWAHEIEQSGEDFYAHKTGFTPKSLHRVLRDAGFGEIVLLRGRASFDLAAYAFRGTSRPDQRTLLGLPPTN